MTRQYPNPSRVFKKKSQTRLLKLNPVPLGAEWVPEKNCPIVIPRHDPNILYFNKYLKKTSFL